MATEVKMPQLGLTMEEGTIVKWLKKEGDEIKVGDELVEISTDKLSSNIESEVDGVLISIVAKEGEDIPVQGLVAYIGALGEKIEASSAAPVKAEPEIIAAAEVSKEEKKAVIPADGRRIKISPLAKKTAIELGVDYSDISGSGSSGRIIQKDILDKASKVSAAAEKPAKAVTAEAVVSKPVGIELMDGDEIVKLTGMRKVVAERMFASHNQIPPVTQTIKVDVSKLLKLRKEINSEREEKLSVNDFILKATAKVLKSSKNMLASIDGDKVIKRAHVNLGMAVALDEGLIVPVIRDADKMGIEELSKTAKDLAIRARDGGLGMEEYKGSTFTVSNLGMFGIESFTPIINQPDAAILGVCAIEDELAMDDEGKVFKKSVIRLSLTYDHRLIDGATAAVFEQKLKQTLEEPMNILL